MMDLENRDRVAFLRMASGHFQQGVKLTHVRSDKPKLDAFTAANKQHIAHDHDGDIVYLTRLQWDIDRVERDYPDITLTATKEMMV